MIQDRARLSYQDQLKAAKAFIEKNDDFLVVSHVHPDGDAASSTFAAGWLLQSLSKRFTLVNEGPMPEKFRYMWGSDRIVDYSNDRDADREFPYVIAVDCADFSRMGEVKHWFADNVRILNIDHHPTNDYFGHVHLIKEDAAATAQVLYDLAESFQLPWSKELATCIYTGLLTDTGGFRYSNTTPAVMNIAAGMLGYGVEGNRIAEELLERLTLAQIQLLRKALSTLAFASDNKIAWLYLTAEDIAANEAGNEDMEGLVNYPRNIEGVQVGILFKQVDAATVKVSLRSAGVVDVSAIAKELGGGGHIKAAGCTVAGSLSQVVESVIDRIGKVML
jgi:phosphoesterase RecJ-like protein